MSLWDPGSIASMIARLVSNPTVNYAVDSVKRAIPQASGPFVAPGSRLSSSSGMGNIGGGNRKIMHSRPGAGASVPIDDQGPGGMDPLMNMYQQLLDQLQSPVKMPTAVDTENLMQQVKAALNPIYDQRASSAEKRTGRATKEVKEMYRALSDDYERLAPQQIAQADAAQKEVEDLYGQLRSNIEGSYSRVSKEQGDLFKSLGIEAALPDVLDEQAAPVQEASIAASQNQAQQEQRYMDMGQMDSTYYREGSPNATMTGNEISTDFLSQLQDYLGQVEAERSSGIQSAYMDQLGQAQTQLGQQQQSAQGEMARRQEMLWQMLQGQLKGGQQQQELNPDTFMQQLPQNMQQSVAGAFTRLQRSPEAVYGKTEDKRNPVPGTFVETRPEWYLQQADQMLERGEIDATTHQALQMYMQLYFQMGS
jgi:hypothetical protein